jgi:uncharacterized membrane protein YidH (DUF202 family)
MGMVIGVVILVSASLTYQQLKRFPMRHADRLKRLTVHMILCSSAIICAIVALIVVSVVPLNSSFTGFYVGRCWFDDNIVFCVL